VIWSLGEHSVPWNVSIRVRTWPLIFSALAAWGLVWLVPTVWENFRYWRGTHTIGWYADFGPEYRAGRPYFCYAYAVGTVTYGGRGLYDDDTSDIYQRKVGDPIGVTYLPKTPWESTMRPTKWDLQLSATLAAFCSALLVLSLRFACYRSPASRNQTKAQVAHVR
jgi:hypothetical protein